MDELSKTVKAYMALGEDASEDDFWREYDQVYALKAQWSQLYPAAYSVILMKTMYYMDRFNQSLKALDFIEEEYPKYESLVNYQYREKGSIQELWAKLCVENDKEPQAYQHLRKALFYLYVDNVSYGDFEYFSFRDFTDYALKDIEDNTLCLAHPSTFNDPMDTLLFRWNAYMLKHTTDEIEKTWRMLYQKTYDHLKVRCFVRTQPLPRNTGLNEPPIITKQKIEDVNQLMWAHYAHNHQGFCIKYKLSSSIVRNINEENLTWTRIGNVVYQKTMSFQSNEKQEETKPFTVWDALFAKHDIWSYENEVRLVHYDPNDESNFKTIPIPPDSIVSIYLGIKCSDENRKKMKLILRNRDVRLYQMRVDDSESYKLVKERIM